MAKRAKGCGSFVFLVILAVLAGVAVAVWRGTGPLPDPEGCSASVGGLDVGLDLEQGENAALIAAIGLQRGLPARAVSIALATAYQESKIRNLTYGDRDSIGIFQQRPSQGWGTVEQIRDRHYSIDRFYEALEKVDGYETMRITEAAQLVQRSGFPEAYQDHAEDGRALASALTGYSAGGAFTCVVNETEDRGRSSRVISTLTRAYGDIGAARTGTRQDVAVPVQPGQDGTRQGWSVAGFLVAHADTLRIRSVSFDGKVWTVGRDSEKGWVASEADDDRVLVSLG